MTARMAGQTAVILLVLGVVVVGLVLEIASAFDSRQRR